MATVKRVFTDDDGKLSIYTISSIRIMLELPNGAIRAATTVPSRATIAERWSALATACEASETLRPYARRIRHMLGTAAGIDTP